MRSGLVARAAKVPLTYGLGLWGADTVFATVDS